LEQVSAIKYNVVLLVRPLIKSSGGKIKRIVWNRFFIYLLYVYYENRTQGTTTEIERIKIYAHAQNDRKTGRH